MKRSVLFAVVMLTVAGARASAQGAEEPQKSPRKVVEDFWRMETEGGRLTAKGWNEAGAFFVSSSSMPAKKQISVVYKGSTISDAVIRGAKADVTVEVLPQGRIDSALIFTPSEPYKAGLLYHLILTDKHWEKGSVAAERKEVKGSSEWRIEGPNTMIWINVDTAIRYVTEMRDKTTDPVLKKNADVTLAKLKSMH